MRILLLLTLTLLISCKNSARIDQQNAEKLPVEFVKFYEKFHADTAYQLAHCVFPMQGLPDQADSTVSSDFRWNRNNWELQTNIELPQGYVRSFSTFGPEMVIERMKNEQQKLGMERRWAKLAGEWGLYYYVGLNQYNSTMGETQQ